MLDMLSITWNDYPHARIEMKNQTPIMGLLPMMRNGYSHAKNTEKGVNYSLLVWLVNKYSHVGDGLGTV